MNLIDLLFPRLCSGCKTVWSYLCKACKHQLKPHPEICPITHKDSSWYAVRQDLLTIPNPLDWCIVLFRFEPLIKKLILWLKYRHRRDISGFLGERLALALQSHEILSNRLLHSSQWQFTIQNSKFIISFVPSHRIRRHITKWYNQSKLLAKEFSQSLERSSLRGRVGRVIQICSKTKHTHSQVGMSKEQRKSNLTDAFEVIAPIPAWSTIIIVDDVLTSWATMIEMAQTIKKSQPDCQVWGLCIARNG